MSYTAIQAENISKKYNLGTISSGTLFRDLNMYWAKMRGKSNPYAKLGDNGEFNESEHWALRDVSFEIKQGEAVGIIGRNGAGKSTLLKILSRVTTPTTGQIKIRGRVASLLEVGTGFHPEMTGRENIFLNGAILGMTKAEIKKKFDEIVDFAGIEKYIDTPVKRYSSGMYVRLAFAVAAHLEPEILIVDEVLAVGDAEFQKKCLGKMNDVSKKEGRTVLFVSHNMGAVQSLCEKGILLENGVCRLNDRIENVIKQYYSSSVTIKGSSFIGPASEIITIENVKINNSNSNSVLLDPSDDIEVIVEGIAKQRVNNFRITFSLFYNGLRFFSTHDSNGSLDILEGKFTSRVKIPSRNLRPGVYYLAIGGYESSKKIWFWADNIMQLVINEIWDNKMEYENFGVVDIACEAQRFQ